MRMKIEPLDIRVDIHEQRGKWTNQLESVTVFVYHIPTGLRANEFQKGPRVHLARMRAMKKLSEMLENEPMPTIFRTYYPKSKRHYWRVSKFVSSNRTDVLECRRKRWDAAHRFVQTLNAKIGLELEKCRNLSKS